MSEEKRRSPRKKPDEPVPAQIRTFVPCQVVDLSEGGILLRVRKPLRRGATFFLKLQLSGVEVELAAIARHCRLVGFDTDEEGDRVRAYEVGLEFQNPIPEPVLAHHQGDPLSVTLHEDGGSTR